METQPTPETIPDNQELAAFYKELDETIAKAESLINETYVKSGKTNKDLQENLKNYVRKLHSLQFEMRAIYENIISLKAKVKAVKSNIHDHHKKIKLLKVEEERQKQKLLPFPTSSKKSEIPVTTPARRTLDSTPSASKPPKVTFFGPQSKKPRTTRRKWFGNTFPKPPENGVTLFLHPLSSEDLSQSQYEDIPEETPSMSKVEAAIPDIDPETARTPTPIPSLASISWRSTRMSLQSSGTNNSISSSRQGFFPMNFDDADDID